MWYRRLSHRLVIIMGVGSGAVNPLSVISPKPGDLGQVLVDLTGVAGPATASLPSKKCELGLGGYSADPYVWSPSR